MAIIESRKKWENRSSQNSGLSPSINRRLMETVKKKTVASYIRFLAKRARQSADVASVNVKNRCIAMLR